MTQGRLKARRHKTAIGFQPFAGSGPSNLP